MHLLVTVISSEHLKKNYFKLNRQKYSLASKTVKQILLWVLSSIEKYEEIYIIKYNINKKDFYYYK